MIESIHKEIDNNIWISVWNRVEKPVWYLTLTCGDFTVNNVFENLQDRAGANLEILTRQELLENKYVRN